MNTRTQAIGIAILRIAIGIVFTVHGAQKLFIYGIAGVAGMLTHLGVPFPALFAVIVTLVEFLGGVALLLGIGTRLAAVPLVINMAVAILVVHLRGGFFLPNGYEYALTLLLASLGLVFTGSGAFSLDHLVLRSQTPLDTAGQTA